MLDTVRPDRVCTCGPELMMRKVADTCWARGVPFEASLERYMKCGIGICDSCAFGPYLVCRDGPVLDGLDIFAHVPRQKQFIISNSLRFIYKLFSES
jgi:dihydroorotate dehydrogenase electron transfer subunit